MTPVLELSSKYSKAVIICIFHEVRANTLEMNGKIEVLWRETETLNKKFRNKNFNICNNFFYLFSKNPLPLPFTVQTL